MKKSIIITVILAVIAIVTNAQSVQYDTLYSIQYEYCVEHGYEYSTLDSFTIIPEGDYYRISGTVTTVETTRTTVKHFSGLYAVKSTNEHNTVYETLTGFDRDQVTVSNNDGTVFVNILTFSNPIILSKLFTTKH